MSYKQSGDLIYDEEKGMICQLSDPTVSHITHQDIGWSGPSWTQAMANGKRIIEAEDCLTLVTRLAAGQNWREWLGQAGQGITLNTDNRIWHLMKRDDGSICLYWTEDGNPAHNVVWDSLGKEER